jgi:crotonobetainyl-CoA:carnitine CoA-transferase CaiB-like acyl-CoA transferase
LTLPLAGTRILDFTVAWAGPFAGRMLADSGAEVIHLERPPSRGVGTTNAAGFGDDAERGGWSWGEIADPMFRSGIYPDAEPGEEPWNRQGLFNKQNRNKLSLCIDLKAPGAREVVLDLVRVSDVLMDNYTPHAMTSLKLTWEDLEAVNPQLVRVSMSGFGYDGPARDRTSWGPIIEANSGLCSATGYPDAGPLKLGTALPDPFGGIHGAVAVLAALERRDQLGHGLFVDVSQLETYAAIGGEKYLATAAGEEPERLGNRSLDHAPQGVYPARGENEWIAISVTSEEEWAALCDVEGPQREAGLEERRRGHDEIDAEIAAWTGRHDKRDATFALQRQGVRAVPVMSSFDLVNDAQLNARGFIVDWEQPGAGRLRFPGMPIHFDGANPGPPRPSPALGADNEYVLGELLGYDAAAIERLRADGAIATTP